MVRYDFTYGLSILNYMGINLENDQIEGFKQNFEIFYNIRLNMPEKFDSISFLAVLENAYCATLSHGNRDLNSRLVEEFTKRIVSSDLLLRIKNGISLDERVFIIPLN